MFDEKVVTNSLGTNVNIIFNFDEDRLKDYGFRYIENPDYPDKWSIPSYWYYSKYFQCKALGISFNVTYYDEPYKGSRFCIDVLDEEFCQPYDYQAMLHKDPTFIYALKVYKFVEDEMKKLSDAGIISGHNEGDYI